MDELVRRWQRGWGLCRGLAPAEQLGRDGLEVVLGLPGRPREIFALTDDPEVVRKLAAGIAPGTWMTVTTTEHEDEVATLLTELGFEVFAERKTLMSIALADQPDATTGPEYSIELEAAGEVQHVRVVHRSGAISARGMVAVVGGDAVMHDIHTDPEYRRRGLGSVVMSELSRCAQERGAATGLLMATADGVQLYRRLGWLLRATMLTGSGLGGPGAEGGDLRPVLASR